MKNFLYRLKWWIFQKHKDCKRCCLFCKFYDGCFLDITTEKLEIVLDEFNNAFYQDYLSAAERKKGFAYAIARGIVKALEK